MKRVIATTALLIGLVTPAWADLDLGIAEFLAGDYDAALRELAPLATSGNPGAQYYLGLIHNYRTGVYHTDVAQDPVQAASWFRRAAEQGHGEAQFALAFMYSEGRGVKRSAADARLWFRRAEASGVLMARSYLGNHGGR